MLRFDYIEPPDLKGAAALLSVEDPIGKIIAGGTDILVQLKDQKMKVDRLVSLAKIPGLRFIQDDGRWIKIGAMTTIRDLERSCLVQQSLPILFDAVEGFGSVQIRNVATVGGNVCSAAPSADTIPPLLALKAKAACWCSGEMKEHGLDEFFLGPGKTLLGPREILTGIFFEKPRLQSAGAYLKLSRRKGMDLPLLGIAIQIQLDERQSFCEDVMMGLGVAGPVPMRLKRSEEVLRGQEITDKILADAADLASQEAKPRDSFRCSAEYRREMIKNLLPTVVRSAIARIGRGMKRDV